jgi:hypothetical protein
VDTAAYSATAVSYTHKIFIKLTTGGKTKKIFFISSPTSGLVSLSACPRPVFCSSLIFTSKTGAYLSGVPMGRLLALFENIRLGYQGLPGTPA